VTRRPFLALLAVGLLSGCFESRPAARKGPDPVAVDAAHSRHWLPREKSELDCMEAGTSGPTRKDGAVEAGRANRLPETWWKNTNRE
jgi:hypothetical protein